MAEPLDFTHYTEKDIQTPASVRQHSLDPFDVVYKTFGKAVLQNARVPWDLGQALGSVIKDPFRGKWPGETVGNAIVDGVKDSQARASLEDRTWFPGSETVQNIKQGWQEGNADRLSSGLGDVLGAVAPVAALRLPGSKLGKGLAAGRIESAAKNYEKIFNPLGPRETAAPFVPSVKMAAKGLANSPETIKGSEEVVSAQLKDLTEKYGKASGSARYETPTIPVDELKKTIKERFNKHIYLQGSYEEQIKNPTAKSVQDDLLARIDKAAHPGKQLEGIAKYGEPRQMGGPPLMSEKAADELKDLLNTEAKGRKLVMEKNPTLEIQNEARWQRFGANLMHESLNGINDVADRVESAHHIFKTSKDLYEAGRNRAFIDRAEGGIGLPFAVGGGGKLKAVLPSGIKDMLGGIKWNTVMASNKKAIANSLATGNWKKTITLLQLTKLGVPLPESYHDNE